MRRFLVVTYDVTSLSEAEIDGLAGEALAQAERSDLHASVEAVSGRLDLEGVLTYVGHFGERATFSAILLQANGGRPDGG